MLINKSIGYLNTPKLLFALFSLDNAKRVCCINPRTLLIIQVLVDYFFQLLDWFLGDHEKHGIKVLCRPHFLQIPKAL